MAHEEIPFKDISMLSSGGYFPAERNRLGNFGSSQYEDHLCIIITILDQWFQICCFHIFVFLTLSAIFIN